ncbi:hypothetical protein LTR91_025377 [Friedmanniomyces endolithicus]|uniref:HMA domain-containing protein n=1 Tax=Friedmanniomyces endolithicus TaxID=329885 RepID=A0AAN6JWM1_9PEZI|nr:hypothetical protein LTR94_022460 [Friedmanniomyces endolithicus]KAK0768274.1 hypothetical protein LTR59_017783 [Friedmanniomyces endolithicus]KAK0770649.1 hypothetical protein LTR38_017507 [Friedmanniomyces endolithicus]KAK0771351.1 hypothetical protein LTR75_017683 [Friedmanniomyces endolithicus]KAK0950839.1 hypothetical protein LTR91_025377 [Friedmanniomyces endolithicus]
MIANALDEAGYDVESISPEGTRDTPVSPGRRGGSFFSRSLRSWGGGEKAIDKETKKEWHRSHCELCRTQYEDAGRRTDRADQGTPEYSAIAIDSLSSQPDNFFRATLSINGMSCSSCIGKIVTTLEERAWVVSVIVAMATQSAVIDFRGRNTDAAQFTTIIDDLGYETSLVDTTKMPTEAGPHAAQDAWKATCSIEGMTCSSCVGTITQAIQGLSRVQSVDVSLVSNSATVVFEGKHHLDEITTTIEDVGYGATVNDVVALMGCIVNIAPARLPMHSINRFNGRVTIDKFGAVEDPIFSVSYVPEAPDYSIRAILAAISSSDPAFAPTVYHPPTLEERAKRMHARLQRRIFYRVLLSVIVVIPTFIIGIVYMALVSATNSARRYFMQPLHGVSRAEWALFVMATPVYLFAADLFHRRTIKELHSTWRPGSSVPMLRRFHRLGSMDMLISLGTTIAYFSSLAELIIAAASPHTRSVSINSTYFDSVVFLTMFLLIGRIIEAYSKAKTGDAVATLQHLRPREALLMLADGEAKADGRVEAVNVDLIDLTDIVRVVHGGTPPWDGVIVFKDSIFDESSLTGESRPVTKLPVDTVYSGTINKGGPVSVRLTRAAGDSMLDQIIGVVREGQARRAPIERVADSLTSYFVPVVTLVAIATWLFGWDSGSLALYLGPTWTSRRAAGFCGPCSLLSPSWLSRAPGASASLRRLRCLSEEG